MNRKDFRDTLLLLIGGVLIAVVMVLAHVLRAWERGMMQP